MTTAVPASEAITSTNVFTQAFANVFNLVDNRSNIPLPSGLPSNHKFVYSRRPNFMSLQHQNFPLIYFDDVENMQGKKSADISKAMTEERFSIIIVVQDKKADSSGNPIGFATLNDISNNFIATLNNRANLLSLRKNGLKNSRFPSISRDFGEIDGTPTFGREFTLMFKQLRRVAS